eukprot:12290446-Karenia_brevis.AAC.1
MEERSKAYILNGMARKQLRRRRGYCWKPSGRKGDPGIGEDLVPNGEMAIVDAGCSKTEVRPGEMMMMMVM